MTLSPAAGQQEQHSSFTITNTYTAPIELRVAFAAPVHAVDADKQVLQALSVDEANVTLAAGQSITKTISLHATNKLAPGSQRADVVILQSPSASGVRILPELRLPIILIKEDGAITSLGLGAVARPIIAFNTPTTIDVTLKNTGNMIAIPRGFVTITTPGGKVIGKGTLNTSSAAINPGSEVRFTTPLTILSSAALPGFYNAVISYGLGGDLPSKTGDARFLYIAWWHIAVLLGLGGGAYYLLRHVDLSRRPAKEAILNTRRPTPKRKTLIGRDIT
jgi:hypothetical protein